MPYIGRELERGTYLRIDDISSSFDGDKKTFNLTTGGTAFHAGSPQALIVSLAGTVLAPVTSYGIDNDKIIFETAPTSGQAFFCISLGVPYGFADDSSIDDGSLTGIKLSKPFSYDDGLLYLDSTNNKIGINSISPSEALDIVGNLTVSGNISAGGTITYDDVTNIDSIGVVTARSGVHFGEASDGTLVVGDSTGVGIGTTNPKSKFNLYNGATSNTGGILIQNINYASNQNKPYLIAGTHSWNGETTNWNSYGFQHRFKTDENGSPRVTIDSSSNEIISFKQGGQVGIGTSNPSTALHLGDDHKISLGYGKDLKIYHDGSHSYIEESGTGSLRILTNLLHIRSTTNDETLAKFTTNGSNELYYNNNRRFLTTEDGIQVLGPNSGVGVGIGTTAAGDALILAKFQNTVSNSSKLQILSKRDTDGTDWTTSYSRLEQTIDSTSMGYIQFNGSDNTYGLELGTHNNEKFILCERNDAVTIYHDNSPKMTTTGTGVTFTGGIGITTTSHFYGTIEFPVAAINTYDPTFGTSGSDTATNVAISLARGTKIVSHASGYIRNLLTQNSSSHPTRGAAIQIGQENTSLITGIDIMPGMNLNEVRLHAGCGDAVTDNVKLRTVGTGVTVHGKLKVTGIGTDGSRLTSEFDYDTTINGSIAIGGTSVSANAGGQINLTKAPNSSINGLYLAIDQNVNKIRFFETGSPARGAYIDITDCADAAGSKIWHDGNLTNNNQLTNGAGYLTDSSGSNSVTIDKVLQGGDTTARKLVLSNASDNSLTDAALHLSAVNGAIIFDDASQKRISWNDGGGNWNFRLGHYYNSGLKTLGAAYGAVEMRMDGDAGNGQWYVRCAPAQTGATAGDAISNWGSSLSVSATACSWAGNQIITTGNATANLSQFLRSDASDVMNGDLTVGGSAVGGNEGGQINLTHAPNSTLGGTTVAIDQYIDRIRFFEQGGDSRGAYHDFTKLPANADSLIFSEGLISDTFNVQNVHSFSLPNGVVSISTSTQAHIPLTVTNSGGHNADNIIAKFVGDSDSLQIRNVSNGDYFLGNSQQENGILFYDGSSGMAFEYDDSRKASIVSTGLKLNAEMTMENDNQGLTFYGTGRIYKKTGGGMALRKSNGGQEWIMENNAGTEIGTLLHSGNIDDVDLPAGIKITGSGTAIEISASSPQMKFSDTDTDADDFYIHVNTNKFYIITDTDDDNTWNDESDYNYPLVLNNATKRIESYGSAVLSENVGFNPYDVVHGYDNDDANSVRFNFTEMAMELSPPFGAASPDQNQGLVFPAFRVNTNTGEKFKVSVQLRSAATTSTGVYFRVYEYDSELPDGKTHISNSATNAVVQEDTRQKTTSPAVENIAGTTDWVTHTVTYTPTSTAVWASVVIINWTGHGTTSLYVRDYKRELDLSDASIGIASQVDVTSDSTGTTAKRVLFSSANSGTCNIQADNDDGITYKPSTGLLDCTLIDSTRQGNHDDTGNHSTSGYLEAGRGGGGVALTINDGYGNANVTFNHRSGIPEQNGVSGRIEVNTDSTTADGAFMKFQLKSGVTADGNTVNPSDLLNIMGKGHTNTESDGSTYKVGVLTNSPEATLHVESTHAASDVPTLKLSEYRPSIHWEDLTTDAVDFQLLADGNQLELRYGNSSSQQQLATIHTTFHDDGRIWVGRDANVGSGKLQVSTTSSDCIDINAYSTTAGNGGRLTFYRSKGGLGTNTVVANGDTLGRIDFRGFNDDASGWNNGAMIEAMVSAEPSTSTDTTDMPTSLIFRTSGDGSASPTSRLHIDHNGNIGVNVTPATSGTLFNTVDHFIAIGDNDTGIAQDGDGVFEIWCNNTEVFRCTNQLVIAEKEFRVQYGDETDPGLTFDGDANTGLFRSAADEVSITNGGTRCHSFEGDSYRIGQFSSASPGWDNDTTGASIKTTGVGCFSVSGTGGVVNVNSNSNSAYLVVLRKSGSVSGSIMLNHSGNNVDYNTSSDYRLKENIVNITNGIDVVKQLKPRNYSWINAPAGETDYGFIAHEVQSIIPQAITGEKDEVDENNEPVHQQISLTKLIPHLTKAIQELIERVEVLESKVS